MNLSSLLAIAGGVVGLAAGGDTASQIASGAAIVSGVAGAMGNSNLAKIAGVASLGAGAYDLFSGDSSSTSASSDAPTSIASDPTSPMNAANLTAPGLPSMAGSSLSQDASASNPLDSGSSSSSASQFAQPATPAVASMPTPSTQTSPIVNTTPSGASSGSLFDQAGNLLKNNKELVTLAGGALNGMFGPQAKQVSLLEQRLKMQQDEINRQNTNSNNIVALTNPVSVNPTPIVRRTPIS